MAQRLEGQVWFIVGGSSGIGLATARQVVTLGGSLALFARRSQVLEEARVRLQRQTQHAQQRVCGFVLDVGDPQACHQALAQAIADLGAPHVVLNSAGSVYPGYFLRLSQAQFEEMLTTNLRGAWNLSQAALPSLTGTRGTLVHVASMAGLIGTFGYSAYAASKFGVIGLAEALRNELRPQGVHVAVVCPPDTDTPQLQAENRIKPPETRVISSTVRPLSPDRVARCIVRGVAARRFMIIPGLYSRLIYRMVRLFPRLVHRIIDADVRKAQRSAASHRLSH